MADRTKDHGLPATSVLCRNRLVGFAWTMALTNAGNKKTSVLGILLADVSSMIGNGVDQGS
jgi:hypothetical protein